MNIFLKFITVALVILLLVEVYFIVAVGYPYLQSIRFFDAYIPQQETFTELYFENHLHLPTRFSNSQSQPFSFTIHNLEGKDMIYPYEFSLRSPNKKKEVLDTRVVVIKNNEKKTITEIVPSIYEQDRSEVVVTLLNKNQQIDFWMEGNK